MPQVADPLASFVREMVIFPSRTDDDTPIAGFREQLFAVARDLNRIYHEERSRLQEMEEGLHQLEDSYLATVRILGFIVHAADAHTRSHLDRAHDYAVALARRVAPDLADEPILQYGSLLHDIGKLGVPEKVLAKAGPLTADEWEMMRRHPALGGQLLRPARFLAAAAPVVEAHHERWDGAGYPRGLKGDQIPLAARIFSVADAFDAMTTNRPYRGARPLDGAVTEISLEAGKQFDPVVAETFVRLYREGEIEKLDRHEFDEADSDVDSYF